MSWRAKLGIGLGLVLAAAGVTVSGVVGHNAGPTLPATICHPYEREAVGNFFVYNDAFRGGVPPRGGFHDNQCLNVQANGSWSVSQSTASNYGDENEAYPDEFYGSTNGLHSRGSILPEQVSQLPEFHTTWNFTQPQSGKWGAGYDMWFTNTESAPQPAAANELLPPEHATGETASNPPAAEVMIWPSEFGFPSDSIYHWQLVFIEGHRYYVEHWITGDSGQTWQYVQFHRAYPTGDSDLTLGPFLAYAQAQGWIKPTYWLQTIQAGYEIWAGGTGLTTDGYTLVPQPQGGTSEQGTSRKAEGQPGQGHAPSSRPARPHR